MYNDIYYTNPTTTFTADYTWLIISVVLAIVGGVATYLLFTMKENKGAYTGHLELLHDFLNFKVYFIEIILKVMYVISAIAITLGSFSVIGSSVAGFFGILIFGNIAARISFEMVMMLVTLVKNTTEINKKMEEKNTKAECKNKKVIEKSTKEE